MKRLRLLGTWLIGLLILGALAWQAVPVQAQETVTAQFRLQISALNRLLIGLRTVTTTLDQDYTQLFSSGTGANQANALYQASRTLSASANETLDLNASLSDDFGQSVTCTKLRAISVHAASGNTNNVIVGGGNTTVTALTSTGAFTNAGLVVRPNGTLIWTFPDSTGGAITAGSSDLLQFTNSSGSTSVTYDVILVCAE